MANRYEAAPVLIDQNPVSPTLPKESAERAGQYVKLAYFDHSSVLSIPGAIGCRMQIAPNMAGTGLLQNAPHNPDNKARTHPVCQSADELKRYRESQNNLQRRDSSPMYYTLEPESMGQVCDNTKSCMY